MKTRKVDSIIFCKEQSLYLSPQEYIMLEMETKDLGVAKTVSSWNWETSGEMTIGEVDQSGDNSSQILDKANLHRLKDWKNEKHRHL